MERYKQINKREREREREREEEEGRKIRERGYVCLSEREREKERNVLTVCVLRKKEGVGIKWVGVLDGVEGERICECPES